MLSDVVHAEDEIIAWQLFVYPVTFDNIDTILKV